MSWTACHINHVNQYSAKSGFRSLRYGRKHILANQLRNNFCQLTIHVIDLKHNRRICRNAFSTIRILPYYFSIFCSSIVYPFCYHLRKTDFAKCLFRVLFIHANQVRHIQQFSCSQTHNRLYFLTDLIDRAFYLRSGVLERTFTGEQFRSLPDPEREALGLRTLTPAVCTLPSVEPAGTKEGLSIEGLACAFRKEAPVFRDLSFSARPGEVVAITGPNGVGKTTLSRCLCGLLKEQAGQILLNGKPLDRKGRQRSAFCVMQDVNHQLFSDSVWGECQMSAPEASDDQISEVLDSLHLLSFRERHPMSLSGGQKQRLAVATALLSEKPVLIFDEPTSGLDYARMVEVSGVIRSLARHERIVLVVTHDQEFMQRACDRVLRL